MGHRGADVAQCMRAEKCHSCLDGVRHARLLCAHPSKWILDTSGGVARKDEGTAVRNAMRSVVTAGAHAIQNRFQSLQTKSARFVALRRDP